MWKSRPALLIKVSDQSDTKKRKLVQSQSTGTLLSWLKKTKTGDEESLIQPSTSSYVLASFNFTTATLSRPEQAHINLNDIGLFINEQVS